MIQKLIDLCKSKSISNGHLYIQTHNYPDADAISSALGLQTILKTYDIDTKIVYVGEIDNQNTLRLVQISGINIENIDGTYSDEDWVICIDSQKNQGNITQNGGHIFACLDHHPKNKTDDYEYQDIQITGACASLVTQYLNQLDISIPSSLATALVYGIKMDTMKFTRGVSKLDLFSYASLISLIDSEKLSFLETSNISLSELPAYSNAIKNTMVLSDIGSSFIDFACTDALIASISDFLISINELSVAIVFSQRENGIKLSVRSILPYIDAGILTKNALDGIGSGGGHSMFAGGFIPKSSEEKIEGNKHDFLTKRFLKTYGILMMENK